MDECDRGKIAEDKYLGGAIAAGRHAANRCGAVLQFCRDCGDEIPDERRNAAGRLNMPCERCVRCQTITEEMIRCRR